MTIEDDITAWALERPGWQQKVLVALANGEQFDTQQIAELTDAIISGEDSAPTKDAKEIRLKSSLPAQVRLTEIGETSGVNALVDGQTLSIGATGLTIIYGDNGSGKSGYARLIKSLVKARHGSTVLPDVFKEGALPPTAVLKYSTGQNPASLKYPSPPNVDTLKMSFYDEHCGDEYLSKQSVISYRPSALRLLDGLIRVCDLVQAEIKARQARSEQSALHLNVPPETTAGAFVASLTAKTTASQIDQAASLSPSAREDLASALQEEARLRGSDPTKEKTRLSQLAAQLSSLATGLERSIAMLSVKAINLALEQKTSAEALRTAANLAANKSFETEPLAGVGATTWRAMWEAARAYSTTYPYHDHEFPVTDEGARCVLCQQELDGDAQDRLKRFDAYMRDTTERDASQAEAALASTVASLDRLIVRSPEITNGLHVLTTADPKLAVVVESVVAKLEEQRALVLGQLAGGPAAPPIPAYDIPARIARLGSDLQSKSDATDTSAFNLAITTVSKRIDELSAAVQLNANVARVSSEVERLIAFQKLTTARAQIDTSAITQKSSALTREYATKLILDQFTRESERLQLRRVTLKDLGGQKGQLNQMPGLLGAKHQGATPPSVLSEGEQTALGLAGFFVEAEFDTSKSAVIFDDPVTSLDHVRRDKVAMRLAELAKDRQVVVFTHDVSFVGDLAAAAITQAVGVTERAIERRGTEPGICLNTFPWKTKDFKSRLDHLTKELARLKSVRSSLVTDAWEAEVAAWGGYLSETWEGAVTNEVLHQVFDRATSQVRVMKFRALAKITEADNTDFQDGYGKTSKWARRHNKAAETNYVAPELAELEAELSRIREWQKRIKSYLN